MTLLFLAHRARCLPEEVSGLMLVVVAGQIQSTMSVVAAKVYQLRKAELSVRRQSASTTLTLLYPYHFPLLKPIVRGIRSPWMNRPCARTVQRSYLAIRPRHQYRHFHGS